MIDNINKNHIFPSCTTEPIQVIVMTWQTNPELKWLAGKVLAYFERGGNRESGMKGGVHTQKTDKNLHGLCLKRHTETLSLYEYNSARPKI